MANSLEQAFNNCSSVLEPHSDEWTKILTNFLGHMCHAREGIIIGKIYKMDITPEQEDEFTFDRGTLYHGTNYQNAINIAVNGYDVAKCKRSSLGLGFYASKHSCKTLSYGDYVLVMRYKKVKSEHIERAQVSPKITKKNIKKVQWDHDERCYKINGATLPAYIIQTLAVGRCNTSRSFSGSEILDIIDSS